MMRWSTKSVPSTVTELDLAQLAAFVDGEGSISLCRYRHKTREGKLKIGYKAKIDVANTDPKLMLWLKRFGVGYVFCKKGRRTERGIARRNLYVWTVRSREAVELVKLLLPHFVMKREQAELFMEFTGRMFYSSRDAKGRWNKLDSETVASRDVMVERLKELRVPPQEIIQ